ncbi:MAG: hypothetical protein ACYDAL_14140 [Candidatus Dormibacteraceae bacterium]
MDGWLAEKIATAHELAIFCGISKTAEAPLSEKILEVIERSIWAEETVAGSRVSRAMEAWQADEAARRREAQMANAIGEAIAKAVAAGTSAPPRSGSVEVLAKDAKSRPELMRRADGSIVKFDYDSEGAIAAIHPVPPVDLDALLKQSAANRRKADDGLEGLREMAAGSDRELAESARRELRRHRELKELLAAGNA